MPTAQHMIAQTRNWIQQFVIRHNLCPFAAKPFQAEKVGFHLSEAKDPESLLHDLADALTHLQQQPAEVLETTLLIHPYVLTDFRDYNDFLDLADALLVQMELEGIFQIASFHPQYQFADTAPDAVENYTNRSPYPMLHLLREASVAAAIAAHPDVDSIPARNVALLRELGLEGMP